jgi:hypothetical protein
MSTTPFRDLVQSMIEANRGDYVALQYGCDSARSHSWWRNVDRYGAWGAIVSPGYTGSPARATRVGPPKPDEIPGIARLFNTTEDQVRRMIAADWYGVPIKNDPRTSALVRRLGPVLDQLDRDDVALIELLLSRLPSSPTRAHLSVV